jgi:hypothetical protein
VGYLPFFLCLFFLSFFLRLCVEIFFRLRLRPHGTYGYSVIGSCRTRKIPYAPLAVKAENRDGSF